MFCACAKFNVAEDGAETLTITIDSEDGVTTMSVDESSRSITKSVFTEAETGKVTTKTYSYDSANNLKSVTVNDSQQGIYEIVYGDSFSNNAKSVMSESDEVPVRVQKIQKNYITAKRAVCDSTEADTVEYYYGDDGKLSAIIRIDDKNNVIIKGAD